MKCCLLLEFTFLEGDGDLLVDLPLFLTFFSSFSSFTATAFFFPFAGDGDLLLRPISVKLVLRMLFWANCGIKHIFSIPLQGTDYNTIMKSLPNAHLLATT